MDQILLYISAASDLEREREVLGRAIPDIPVTLGWRIVQTPGRSDLPDLDAVIRADIHLLVLGGDIRAPVGMEWRARRSSGTHPALFLKAGIRRTPAGQDFVRYLEEQQAWRTFKDEVDLRRQALLLISGHILDRAIHYVLAPEEYERLKSWRQELETEKPGAVDERRGATGESGVILSPERYMPSEGVEIRPKD